MRRVESQGLDASSPLSYAAAFAGALLNPSRAIPELLTGPEGKASDKRYGVYRNNVTVSLIDALAAIFPATMRITGERFFRTMARFHICASPPTSPLLFEYGREFPDFIVSYEHAKSMPWLADVARIERGWLDCYHAADATPLAPEALASIPAERLLGTVLTAHPAVRVVRSQYPVVTIFTANHGDRSVKWIEASEPEDALIVRPGFEVIVRRLPPGGASFLQCLLDGKNLGAAAAAALSDAPAFDLAAGITGFLESGAFISAKEAER